MGHERETASIRENNSKEWNSAECKLCSLKRESMERRRSKDGTWAKKGGCLHYWYKFHTAQGTDTYQVIRCNHSIIA